MREQLHQFLQQRLNSGVIYEPRGYFDIIDVLDGTNSFVGPRTPGHPEVFRNGENFPVTITHVALALDYYNQDEEEELEENIQTVGVRLRYHDQYYMNSKSFPAPLWGNKPVGLADTCSFGTSIWNFADGKHVAHNGGGSFVLGARDTLQVQVEIPVTSSYDLTITASFTGIGMLSERPYFLTSSVTRTTGTITLVPNDIRNDGAEPILITDMNLNITGAGLTEDVANTGDIRRLRVNIKQVGGGTNGSWFHGPRMPITIHRCPATLLGITGGRAVIHELPTPLVWNPGDGIDIECNQVAGNQTGIQDPGNLPILHAGLFGYIVVQ